MRWSNILYLYFYDSLFGSLGSIQSPNYPSKYPPNANEEYNLAFDLGKLVQITFQDLEIEDGLYENDCNYDSLTFFDYIDGGYVQARQMCSTHTLPGTFTSKSNKMRIVFHSDEDTNLRGFKLDYIVHPGSLHYHQLTVSGF